MNAKQAQPGSGRIQWSASAWFGAQIGGTLWMLIAASLLLALDTLAAALTLGVFALVNVLGWLLWSRRDRLRPYPTIQVLVLLVGLGALGVTLLLDQRGVFEHLSAADPGSRLGAVRMLRTLLLIVPATMVWLHLQDRPSVAKRSPQG